MEQRSYASPTAYRKGDLNILITHGNDYCIGHDPVTGKELWRVAGLNPKEQYNRTLRFVASPVVSQGLLVVPSAKNRGVSVVRLSEAKGRIARLGTDRREHYVRHYHVRACLSEHFGIEPGSAICPG